MDKLARRDFLKFVSSHSVALGLSPFVLAHCASTAENNWSPLPPTTTDALVLAEGLSYKIISKYGDSINKDQNFGYNNDFICFHSLNASGTEGILWVNHEYPLPQLIHGLESSQLTRSQSELAKEMKTVGGSLLHIYKTTSGKWERKKDSQYNRRLDGHTPIAFSQNVKIQGKSKAMGTLANCAGGYTPWKTVLTSEENYDDYYGEAFWHKGKRSVKYNNKFDWYKKFPNPPEHYGWIVEVDPLTGKAEKQVNLGRAPHEGATVVKTKNGKRVAVYMGEDREGGFIFKFVSDGLHLNSGTLYAADTINGKWLPLDIRKNNKLKNNFDSQLRVLTYAHQAAELAGATPQDRPEDIEVHPQNGDVFIALTKNSQKDNPYGSLFKISEKDDHDSTEFSSEHWISAGPKVGVACPDNLCFDRNGNLWFTNDISEKSIEKGPYKGMGNNGLFVVATRGPEAGLIKQVASAPIDAELTGPCFSPDQRTLFLSVQHPGAQTKNDLSNPTSHWPEGGNNLPKPAVVAIQGKTLISLTS